MGYETDASVGTLVRGVLQDVRELVREELALARVEMRQEVTKLSAAGIQAGLGGAALYFGAMFVLVAVALGVSALFDWPLWAGFALLAVLLSAFGGVMLTGARRAIRRVEPLPRTIASIKETFQ